jgi:hypothetical protein
VLALHAIALFGWGPGWLDPDAAPASAPAMQVRSLTLPGPPAMPVVPAQANPPTPKPAVAVQRRAPPRAEMAPAPAAQAVAAEQIAAATPEQGPAVGLIVEAPNVPVYATRLPPPGRWRYRLQRGPAAGEAELQWTLAADGRYQLLLEGRVAGVTLLEWASHGDIDAAGVAPERFAVRRRGRDRQAANFQRDVGKISFSGPTHELPLLPGAQDRLSWIVQLPAIVAAAPERFVAGTSIVLSVAGARGDADVWTFVVQGTETIGELPALKLLREPRRPYDTRVDVWLDPADSYLPLRLLQTPSGGGAALDLLREREGR